MGITRSEVFFFGEGFLNVIRKSSLCLGLLSFVILGQMMIPKTWDSSGPARPKPKLERGPDIGVAWVVCLKMFKNT